IEIPLHDQSGIEVGSATFTESKGGVQIMVEAHHLTAGKHGIHIHEKGICEPPTFASAGAHFNPENKLHGFKNPKGPHAGDLENIEVAADGTVKAVVSSDRVTLQKGVSHSLYQEEGTSLIIHADKDDYKTDP